MFPVLVSLPWAAVVGCLLWSRHSELARRDEREDRLLQRIQAPEVAVAQHVDTTTQGPSGLGYVPVDDDEAMRQNVMELVG